MKILVIVLLAASLGACSFLPRNGPTTDTVLEQATQNGTTRFAMVEVDDRVVDTVLKRPVQGFHSVFAHFGAPPEAKIQIGDTVGVSVWEAGGGSLFTPPMTTPTTSTTDHTSSSSMNTAQNTTIVAQTVAFDGGISVPFAGRVKVAGSTILEAQNRIEKQLRGKAIDPQVIVTVQKSNYNAVTVSGEVVNGARVELAPAGEKVLDVIAEAGGAKAPVYELYVRLSRGNTTATLPFQALVNDPQENIYVWPGDTVTVERIPSVFEAFGATGDKNAQINFGQENVSVAQALAKSAGMLDERADPGGVFLLRLESTTVVREMGINSPTLSGQFVPVVYHFDMDDMKSYFDAQRFPVQNNDVLYVANAGADPVQKLFALVGTLILPLTTGAEAGILVTHP